MAQHIGEPSLEEILASIKKVIAEDGPDGRAPRRRAAPRPSLDSAEDDVLELTDMVEEQGKDDGEPAMIPTDKQRAMRESLAALAALSEPPAAPQIVRSGETSLEGMVREMLRPMLAEWLDRNMPDLVEAMVAREIARITGKRG
ncbi:MAG: DUF2497 domain-containing protein [Blastomonas sp.]